MSEGILLPAVPRETLLPESARLLRLKDALPQIHAVTSGETDAIALFATVSCLLWETLVQTNWCGFYRRVGPTELAVGPYQGSLGCLRIDFSRGVCGRAARTREVQLVSDVSLVDHIACDARTRSELVVPVIARGDVRAVLDLDSPYLDAFSEAEANLLKELMRSTFDQPDVVFPG